MKKILVWLSWWVDSAVAAYILQRKWYDVTAGFMINYLAPEGEYCPTKSDLEVAKEVAEYLKLPFFTFDYRDEYEKKVLDYMYEWYKKWITPNPDIMCNSEIKFKTFLDEALDAGFDMVATGHYAQIRRCDNHVYHLKKWVDPNKDQSYFLAWLNQNQLSKSLFPIWHLKKSEVRSIAKKAWIPNAARKESQWICFVGKVDFIKFLEKKISPVPWRIKNTKWEVLWEHNGVFYYTIWQRKKLDIWGQKEPIFVVKKDIGKNEIIVWNKNDWELYSQKLIMKDVHFLTSSPIPLSPSLIGRKPIGEVSIRAKAKIRYRQVDQDCEVFLVQPKNSLLIREEGKKNIVCEVHFKEKQRAIASGQICVIYRDDEVLMSGVICSS